jgi:hypothetical protein
MWDHKKHFADADGYNPRKALAIPNDELERLGVDHRAITTAQQQLYIEFAKKGAKLTWDDMERIETQALVKAKMNPALAKAVVQRAFQHLKDSGVAGPTKTPWGGRYFVEP